MRETIDRLWIKLRDYESPRINSGAMIRFRTLHTAGNEWKYALAVRIDGAEDISFVGLDGGTWGYGRCTLPREARHEGQRYSVSRDWLLANFMHIAEPEDPKDIWISPDALEIMRAFDA